MLRTPGIGEVAADVEVDARGSYPDGMELEDFVHVMISQIGDGGVVRTDLKSQNLGACPQGSVDSCRWSSPDGDAVKLIDVIGILVGEVNHSGPICGDQGFKYVSVLNEGGVQFGGNAAMDGRAI